MSYTLLLFYLNKMVGTHAKRYRWQEIRMVDVWPDADRMVDLLSTIVLFDAKSSSIRMVG